jgi:hypothetical protein
MAIQVLGHDLSAQGEWQIDYDTVGLTVGHTCTSPGGFGLILTVQQVNTTTGNPIGQPFTKDVTADLNQGRVVDLTGIQNSQVPQPVKGHIYPFTFSGTWYAL